MKYETKKTKKLFLNETRNETKFIKKSTKIYDIRNETKIFRASLFGTQQYRKFFFV